MLRGILLVNHTYKQTIALIVGAQSGYELAVL